LLGPRPPAGRDALVIGLLLGLALVTKVSAYVAIPIALAAPLIAWYEFRRTAVNNSPIHHSPINHWALILLPALLLALPWYLRNATLYGNLDILARSWHDVVVVGQLTTDELLAQAGLAATLERFLVWSHSSFWGVFGWMGVWMDARVYTAALAFTVAAVVGCVWAVVGNTTTDEEQRMADAAKGADLDALVTDHRSPITDHRSPIAVHRLPFTDHQSRFRRWSLALLGLSALGTLGIYLAYNLQFVQPQGRYLFPALPFVSLAVAVGWWTVARWPEAARWAGFALLIAAGLAALWGVTQEGINKWSLLIFGGGAVLLLAWSLALPRLEEAAQGRINLVLYGLPFALMALLSAWALWAFILPQLT
jgi:hypothetical protein